MKRGNIMDLAWLVPAFMGIMIVVIALTIMQHSFNDAVQNNTAYTFASDATNSIQDYTDRQPKSMDSGLVFAYIAAHLGIVFLGLLMRSHPFMFPAMMIILLLLTMLAGFMSNAWQDVVAEPDITSFAALYPMTSWVLDNYLYVTLFFGFVDILTFLGISALLGSGGEL